VAESGEGVLDLGAYALEERDRPRGDSGDHGASPSPEAEDAGGGSMAEDPSDSEEAGPEVSDPTHRQKREPVARADLVRAMKAADGNFPLAAAALDMNIQVLRVRVSNDPQLRALWLIKDDPDLTDVDVINRSKLPKSVDTDSGDDVAYALTRQEFKVANLAALTKSGISQETIDKLSVFDRLSEDTGMFLTASLRTSHQIMYVQTVKLFEESERISKEYLEDVTIDGDVRREWYKVYLDITNQLQKAYDRNMAGALTTAKLIAMQKRKGGEGKKKKAGFTPIVAVNKKAIPS